MVSPEFVMTYPDFGFVCAIVTVAEIAQRIERITFFIVGLMFLNNILKVKNCFEMQK